MWTVVSLKLTNPNTKNKWSIKQKLGYMIFANCSSYGGQIGTIVPTKKLKLKGENKNETKRYKQNQRSYWSKTR